VDNSNIGRNADKFPLGQAIENKGQAIENKGGGWGNNGNKTLYFQGLAYEVGLTGIAGIVLQGRWVIVDEKPDGCHIVLIENDVFHLLRVLPYGGRVSKDNAMPVLTAYYGPPC
jgi:hypothetical protein